MFTGLRDARDMSTVQRDPESSVNRSVVDSSASTRAPLSVGEETGHGGEDASSAPVCASSADARVEEALCAWRLAVKCHSHEILPGVPFS